MLTMSTGLKDQAKHAGWSDANGVRFAAMLGALALTSFAVNACIALADSDRSRRLNAAEDCPAVMESADRLACYDRLVHQSAHHPFRGANAPVLGRAL